MMREAAAMKARIEEEYRVKAENEARERIEAENREKDEIRRQEEEEAAEAAAAASAAKAEVNGDAGGGSGSKYRANGMSSGGRNGSVGGSSRGLPLASPGGSSDGTDVVSLSARYVYMHVCACVVFGGSVGLFIGVMMAVLCCRCWVSMLSLFVLLMLGVVGAGVVDIVGGGVGFGVASESFRRTDRMLVCGESVRSPCHRSGPLYMFAQPPPPHQACRGSLGFFQCCDGIFAVGLASKKTTIVGGLTI